MPKNLSNTHSSTQHQVLMGFDYGTVNIGVAVGQTVTQTATAVAIIKSKHQIPNWQGINELVKQWNPDGFVIGLPINMDGSMSPMAENATLFSKQLTKRFNIPSYTIDERLSSREVKSQYFDGDNKPAGKKYAIDSLAAKLILETWLSEQ